MTEKRSNTQRDQELFEKAKKMPGVGDVTKSFGTFEDDLVEAALENYPHLTKEKARMMLRCLC